MKSWQLWGIISSLVIGGGLISVLYYGLVVVPQREAAYEQGMRQAQRFNLDTCLSSYDVAYQSIGDLDSRIYGVTYIENLKAENRQLKQDCYKKYPQN